MNLRTIIWAAVSTREQAKDEKESIIRPPVFCGRVRGVIRAQEVLLTGGDIMKEREEIVMVVLKAVALAMGVASVVLAALKTASIETYIMLLGLGLFALSLAALQESRE